MPPTPYDPICPCPELPPPRTSTFGICCEPDGTKRSIGGTCGGKLLEEDIFHERQCSEWGELFWCQVDRDCTLKLEACCEPSAEAPDQFTRCRDLRPDFCSEARFGIPQGPGTKCGFPIPGNPEAFLNCDGIHGCCVEDECHDLTRDVCQGRDGDIPTPFGLCDLDPCDTEEACCMCDWCCDMEHADCRALGGHIEVGRKCIGTVCQYKKPPCASAVWTVARRPTAHIPSELGEDPGGRFELASLGGTAPIDRPPGASEVRKHYGAIARQRPGFEIRGNVFVGIVCNEFDRHDPERRREVIECPVVFQSDRDRLSTNVIRDDRAAFAGAYRCPCPENPCEL